MRTVCPFTIDIILGRIIQSVTHCSQRYIIRIYKYDTYTSTNVLMI